MSAPQWQEEEAEPDDIMRRRSSLQTALQKLVWINWPCEETLEQLEKLWWLNTPWPTVKCGEIHICKTVITNKAISRGTVKTYSSEQRIHNCCPLPWKWVWDYSSLTTVSEFYALLLDDSTNKYITLITTLFNNGEMMFPVLSMSTKVFFYFFITVLRQDCTETIK